MMVSKASRGISFQGDPCCEDSVKSKFLYTNVLKGYKIENNRWLSGVEATNGE
jgi:hypothetical protein